MLPAIIIADPIVGAEELSGFAPHLVVVGPRQVAVPLNEFFSGQPSTTRKWPHFGDLNPVTGDMKGLSRFNLIHNRRRVVAKLALADHLHANIVAQ
jgi:hypothetical protein